MNTPARPRLSPRRKRALLLLGAGALLAAGGLFVKNAFRSNLVFFVTPSELRSQGGAHRPDQILRVGGLVQAGSVQRQEGSLQLRFALADASHVLPVTYHGVLPDLFAEGKGAIAQGQLDAHGTLVATEVLAKHDENYMPPGAHEAMKKGQTPSGGAL